MGFKYGKLLSYKNIKEAEKLIGKQVVYSNQFKLIDNLKDGDFAFPSTLLRINSTGTPFVVGVWNYEFGEKYEFIREIIEEEKPKYRPFKDVDELAQTWVKKCSDNSWKHRELTMPNIWIRDKNNINKLLICSFFRERVYIEKWWVDMQELLDDYEFLDGSPLGVEVEE